VPFGQKRTGIDAGGGKRMHYTWLLISFLPEGHGVKGAEPLKLNDNLPINISDKHIL